MKAELLRERLEEARSTYKLNLGYCNIDKLPDDFVSLIKKHNPHIIELDLTSNQISSLPDDLHELAFLQALRVKYNRLDAVPPVCFKIQRLTTLDLAGNHIECIPDDIIRLAALRELDVSGNHITSLTGQLDQLPHLTALHLENNQLKSLPESIGFCQGLIKLKCSTNLLRKLPSTLGNLKKIQRLDFANNVINSVPPVMGHLKALKEFTLRYNPLETAYQQASDEGLSKFLAFLKKEEAREEAETRERLRPIGTQVGHFCEFRCKPHRLGAKPGVPGAPAAPAIDDGDTAHKPWTRAGATLCKQGDTFYLFGGVITKTGKKTADLYVLSTENMEWKLQETAGDNIPVARSDHCAVIDTDTNRLIIFGGRSQERKRLNDVWALDLSSFKWFKQACQGTAPRPRDKASAAVCAGVMVIFGGHTQGKRLNDLCVLDLSTFAWSSWTSVMGQPSPREAAALCVGHGNLLFLHGGASNFGLDDLWVYDQKQQAWLEVITEGLKPPARRSHTMYVNGNTMYMFGGIDELGAPSTAMFKAEVEYGANFSTSRVQWQELASDRAFNPNRLVVFDSMPTADNRSSIAQMHCFQLGSRTLGAAITEDVDKGVVFFDVYAVADVAALAVKPVDTEAAVQKHGKRLRVDHSMNRIAKLPRSFTVSSVGETAVAKFLGEYERAYTELYRHRRPLYLLPLNECGVSKFVCTTIRPTKLPYPDLWSLNGAVAFVANAIEYEPVENPLHPPEHLLSPQSVLAFQAGDAFDLSCLLVSLLTGCGFDAYVTVGYAPSHVVQNDQTKQICPLLEQEAQLQTSAETESAAAKVEATKSKFQIKGETKFESEFQKSMQLEESEACAKKAAAEKAATDAAAATEREKHLDFLKFAREPSQRLLHAWVLVKAGARGLTQDTFIETASGRQYKAIDCPYTGIEWCWNHENFWISMDLPEPHSDARLHPARADFDFSDESKWQAVIPPLPELPLLPVESDTAALNADGTEFNSTAATVGGATVGTLGATGKSGTPTQGTGRSVGITFGKGGTNRDAADFGATGDTDGMGMQMTITRDVCATIEMPESWVPRLSVPRDILDMRVPRGTKKTIYQYSELEVFALFGESAKFDGCLQRLSIYEDLEHQIKLEDREYFGRRKDKLYEKRRYYSSGTLKTFVEHFMPGAAYSVKELWQHFETNEAGESILTRQVIEFYVEARIDCLAHKEEVIGVKLIETYHGREDGLVYRSGTYGPAPSADDAAMDKPQPLVKMTEKFQRNPSVSAQSDVARRVFYLSQDAIRVDYQIPEDRITHSYRVYTKAGQSHIVQSDPMLDQVDSMAQLEQFQALLAAEKECSMGIRQSEWESREFAKVRKLLNEAIVLETPYYDITRVNADEDDDEEAAVQEAAFDYLSPFMPNIAGTRGLSREEALLVREACLKALKERLIERANIIQVRHDEEVASLAKRRTNFQRDRDQLAKEAEAEYEEECERSTFKIQILEKRLKHHEEQAICKYYELDNKLRRDPRLACLLS